MARHARPDPAASSSPLDRHIRLSILPLSLSVGRMLCNNCSRSDPPKCRCHAVNRNHGVGSNRSNEPSIARRWRTSSMIVASCALINRSACASGLPSPSDWGSAATAGVTAVYRFHPGAVKNCWYGWFSSHIRLVACLLFSRLLPPRLWQFAIGVGTYNVLHVLDRTEYLPALLAVLGTGTSQSSAMDAYNVARGLVWRRIPYLLGRVCMRRLCCLICTMLARTSGSIVLCPFAK